MRIDLKWAAVFVVALSPFACGDDIASSPPTPLVATEPLADASTRTDALPSDDGAPSAVADAAVDAPSPDAALPAPVPYANPVLNADFPDPTVIRGADRKLYAFGTGGLIQRARSVDLVHWQTIGNALAAKPSWANTKNFFWAPHVVQHAGVYYLYFSAEQNAGTGSFCIGVATAPALDAPFVDAGAPILCGPSFGTIDPMVWEDPATGKALLYWGSGFQPIRAQELAVDRVHLAPGSAPKDLLVTSRLAYERLLEGAWLHPHGGFHYLFNSGDDCCGSATSAPHYAVMVSRSKSPTGPYEDFGIATGAPDNTILVANAKWLAPGHNAVITDDAGTEWMIYHAIDAAQGGARRMLIDRITYVNGWPSIAGRTPSIGMQVGPVFRP